jgi:uncharacterized membrane protein YhaH (DUF805 family)
VGLARLQAPVRPKEGADMSFTNAIQVCFNKYATFSGRASRSEYWWFYLFTILVNVVFSIIFAATQSSVINGLSGLFALAVLLPSLAVATRRLHDVGRSGWWQLLVLTVIGVFVLLYWFVQPSANSTNEYGAPPV